MNYFKNHIYVMALLATSIVFSAYGSQPQEAQPTAKATSLFKRYPLSMHVYQSYQLPKPAIKEQSTTILATSPNQTDNKIEKEPELINDRLKGKIISAFSRAAWLDHGDQIIQSAVRYWPFLARFF